MSNIDPGLVTQLATILDGSNNSTQMASANNAYGGGILIRWGNVVSMNYTVGVAIVQISGLSVEGPGASVGGVPCLVLDGAVYQPNDVVVIGVFGASYYVLGAPTVSAGSANYQSIHGRAFQSASTFANVAGFVSTTTPLNTATLSGMTFGTNALVVVTPGQYFVVGVTTITATASGQSNQIKIFRTGVANAVGTTYISTGSGNALSSMACVEFACVAGDTISMQYVSNVTAGTSGAGTSVFTYICASYRGP